MQFKSRTAFRSDVSRFFPRVDRDPAFSAALTLFRFSNLRKLRFRVTPDALRYHGWDEQRSCCANLQISRRYRPILLSPCARRLDYYQDHFADVYLHIYPLSYPAILKSKWRLYKSEKTWSLSRRLYRRIAFHMWWGGSRCLRRCY